MADTSNPMILYCTVTVLFPINISISDFCNVTVRLSFHTLKKQSSVVPFPLCLKYCNENIDNQKQYHIVAVIIRYLYSAAFMHHLCVYLCATCPLKKSKPQLPMGHAPTTRPGPSGAPVNTAKLGDITPLSQKVIVCIVTRDIIII